MLLLPVVADSKTFFRFSRFDFIGFVFLKEYLGGLEAALKVFVVVGR